MMIGDKDINTICDSGGWGISNLVADIIFYWLRNNEGDDFDFSGRFIYRSFTMSANESNIRKFAGLEKIDIVPIG
jgi:hypothetical protein